MIARSHPRLLSVSVCLCLFLFSRSPLLLFVAVSISCLKQQTRFVHSCLVRLACNRAHSLVFRSRITAAAAGAHCTGDSKCTCPITQVTLIQAGAKKCPAEGCEHAIGSHPSGTCIGIAVCVRSILIWLCCDVICCNAVVMCSIVLTRSCSDRIMAAAAGSGGAHCTGDSKCTCTISQVTLLQAGVDECTAKGCKHAIGSDPSGTCICIAVCVRSILIWFGCDMM